MLPKMICIYAVVVMTSANFFAPFPYSAASFIIPKSGTGYQTLPNYDFVQLIDNVGADDKAPADGKNGSKPVKEHEAKASVEQQPDALMDPHTSSIYGFNPHTYSQPFLSIPFGFENVDARSGYGFRSY